MNSKQFAEVADRIMWAVKIIACLMFWELWILFWGGIATSLGDDPNWWLQWSIVNWIKTSVL